MSQNGAVYGFLSGLDPNTTYHYQSKATNSAGISQGEAITDLPYFQWDFNDTGATAHEKVRGFHGEIVGATSQNDSSKGLVLTFDGENDYIEMGDIDQLDQVGQFTISLWFNRGASSSTTPTNHGVHNVLLAQSSDSSNDNLEIGSQGTSIQIYIDSGTEDTDTTVTFDAGISNNQWYHLSLVYGSELTLYLDGTKLSTWTQYNGRLDSSGTSPLSVGVARPGASGSKWGDFQGKLHDLRIYFSELSGQEIKILAGQNQPQSFTTGSSIAPPIVRVTPASEIHDSNVTIGYELLSYDGDAPEIIFYWGDFDHGQNEGLWQNSQSVGVADIGMGHLTISGFSPGDEIFYQVRAKGSPFDDWSDQPGKFRTVSFLRLNLTLLLIRQLKVLD